MVITFGVQILSIVVVLLCTCVLFLYPGNKSSNKKDWNYYIKKFISYRRISKFKKNLKHDWLGNGKSLESPSLATKENNLDSLAFYGFDEKGNSLVVRINKRGFQIVEVWLQIRFENGNMYQLPNHPSTCISSKEKNTWSASGMKFTILEPFKKIRITFNGLLQKCSPNDVESQEIIHTKFNLIWSSGSIPMHWPFDQSASLLAESISHEIWENGHCNSPKPFGYDQFGVMYGEMFLEEGKLELNLPSLRSRRKGFNMTDLQRNVELVGVCDDGIMFHIGGFSGSGLTELKFGTVRTMDGQTHALTESDILLESIGSSIENIPRMFVVNFTVMNRKYKCIFYLKMESAKKLYSGNPWNFESNIIPFECSFSSELGQGVAIIEYKYDGPCNEPLIVPRNYLTFADIQESQSGPLVVTFDDKLCQAVSMVGGKGASLSLMSSIESSQFIVPSGFCLTKYSLQKQLQISDLSLLVREVENRNLKQIKELESACKLTESRIALTPLDETIAHLVKEHLKELRNKANALYDQETCRFAVRSSGLNEDSEDSSAAGQNETILGCLTDEDVLAAILKCWGSLFAFRSVAYRRQHGQPVNCGMGVVIQIMVPSEVSGVMFTCHPTTQNPGQILITASYGLGESVVSALVHPDQIIVEKTWDDKISIQSTQIGEKLIQITMSDTSTNTTNVNLTQAQQLCMTDDEILAVAKLGILFEQLFDYYCDVEWAVYRGKIYILQCRAITTTNKWTEFELTHEFDAVVIHDKDIFTFANCIEVLPNPMCTLSITNLPYTANRFQQQIKGYQADLYHYYNSSNPLICQRLCINLLNTFFQDLDKEISMSHRISCLAVLGDDVIDEKMHKVAIQRNKHYAKQKNFFWLMTKDLFKRTTSYEYIVKLAENFNLDLEIFNSRDMFNVIQEALQKQELYAFHHMLSSSSSTFYKIFIMSLLLESKTEITAEHLEDFTKILALENNALSVEIPKSLNEISKIIARSGKSDEFQQIPTSECLQWLKTNVPEAEAKFQGILKEHGHRGIMELDFLYDPWILNPLPLLEALQTTANMDSNKTERNAVNLKNIMKNLKTPKKIYTKLMLKIYIPKLLAAICNREFTKSALVLVMHKFRLAFRRLGCLLEKEGKLPDADLIHFLTVFEIKELVNENKTELIEKATKRQKLYPKWNQLKFEEYNYGRPTPIPENLPNHMDLDTACTLKGTAVYPGVIQNRACVITDFSQAHLIQPNDILITTATDVGWSPYFPMISGLVTELGGLISHGAVIAREYGIPCVIGVKGATKMFLTDQQVLLDSNKGQISRVITKNQ